MRNLVDLPRAAVPESNPSTYVTVRDLAATVRRVLKDEKEPIALDDLGAKIGLIGSAWKLSHEATLVEALELLKYFGEAKKIGDKWMKS